MNISINTNLSTMQAQRSLWNANLSSGKIMEKLSSGIRINSASDDAADLCLSKKLDSKISGINVANNNIDISIGRLQSLDGHLSILSESIIKMRDLAVQSANGVYSDSERAMLNTEAQQLMGEVRQGTKQANQEVKSMSGETGIAVDQLTEQEALDAGYTVIKTANELDAIESTGLGGKYILMNNIDASELGTKSESIITGQFTGEFNGNGYKISNVSISKPSGSDYTGVFKFIDTTGVVKNTTVENANVIGNDYTGILAGTNRGTIDNCHTSGYVSADGLSGGLTSESTGIIKNSSSTANADARGWNAGGLVGYNRGDIENCFATGKIGGNNTSGGYGGLVGVGHAGSTIKNSYATGDVYGTNGIGSFIGSNFGDIENCYSTGNVSATDGNIGGFAGKNHAGGTISNSYSSGNVDGNNWTGGFVGDNSGTITNAYATGNVTGNDGVGGFAGENYNTIVGAYATGFVDATLTHGAFAGYTYAGSSATNSFWNSDVDNTGVGDLQGGTFNVQGLTTDEILTTGLSLLGSNWASDGVSPHLKAFDETLSTQIGSDDDSISAFDIDQIAINLNFSVELNSSSNSRGSINVLDKAIEYLSSERADIGAKLNRLGLIKESNSNRSQSLTESNSVIRDTDMASEAANFAKNQILTQSAINILQHANKISAETVLNLY